MKQLEILTYIMEGLMFFIKSVSIENFKSIKNLKELELENINILIGPHGSGKSNFLFFFEMVGKFTECSFQHYVIEQGGAKALTNNSTTPSPNIQGKITFQEGEYTFTLSPDKDNCLTFAKEKIVFYKDQKTWTPTKDTENETYESFLRQKRSNELFVKQLSQTFQTYRVYNFNDTSFSAKVRKPCNINDNRYFRTNGENLVAILYLMKKRYRANYDRLLYLFQYVLPSFDDFKFIINDKNPEFIRLQWKTKNTNYMDIAYMPDGCLKILCLLTLFLQPTDFMPKTLFIDNLDTGISPRIIKMITMLIKEISSNTQIIAVAYSPEIINIFKHDCIITTEFKKGQSHFKRLDSSHLTNWLIDNYI